MMCVLLQNVADLLAIPPANVARAARLSNP